MTRCAICGREFEGFGNNPEPILSSDHRCCSECNECFVIPIRFLRISNRQHPYQFGEELED